MATIPKKIEDRIKLSVKKYQGILSNAKSRDVGEADTVTIIKDMLSDIFGYDKYSEVTSEYAIRGTYCDLAIKLDNKLSTLIEVKAIGLELKDQHVKQAIDYAANQGVDWAILTNGINWQFYHVTFSKPIEKELVLEFNLLETNVKVQKDIDAFYLLCKEGWQRSALGEYHIQKQALSRFSVGALLQSEAVLDVIRKELKKVSPDVKINNDEIKDVLISDVIKRDVLEGEKAIEANKKIGRAQSKIQRDLLKNSNTEPTQN